jgi:hypothetical protein
MRCCGTVGVLEKETGTTAIGDLILIRRNVIVIYYIGIKSIVQLKDFRLIKL